MDCGDDKRGGFENKKVIAVPVVVVAVVAVIFMITITISKALEPLSIPSRTKEPFFESPEESKMFGEIKDTDYTGSGTIAHLCWEC